MSDKIKATKPQSDRELTLYWMRRDLRLDDNAALYHALRENNSVLPIFIFDELILEHVKKSHEQYGFATEAQTGLVKDSRVLFIHQQLQKLKSELQDLGSDLLVFYGPVQEVWKAIFSDFKNQGIQLRSVYLNHDYEPKAIARDSKVEALALEHGAVFKTFKDQVIFERNEVLTDQRKPYTVYTPYKKKWLSQLNTFFLKAYPNSKYFKNLMNVKKFFKGSDQKKDSFKFLNGTWAESEMPTLKEMGFADFDFAYFPARVLKKDQIRKYAEQRDFPAIEGTTHVGLHLRFGTVSVRLLAREAQKLSDVWLSELIWRDFFMQILFQFPHVEKSSFRPEYENIKWRHSADEFKKWCTGQTGYPIVDAGMRELNQTGFMHNRVRMVVASFLCKHLMHHWLEGERYFAALLLDYDLSANNGNWQWAAGTGCDAAPYFRVFNPETQTEKFDGERKYIKKWVPELGTSTYPKPMVEHVFARNRALDTFKAGLKTKSDSKK